MPSILTEQDKETVKRFVPKHTNKIQAVAVAKLYVAYPNRSKWTDTGLQGAAVLCNDLVGHTYWVKLVDISPGGRGVIWDQEIYDTWSYNQDRVFFHTFELEECLAGLSFADEKEAKQFKKKMDERERNASKLTRVAPFSLAVGASAAPGSTGGAQKHHGILGGLFGHRHSSAHTPPDSPQAALPPPPSNGHQPKLSSGSINGMNGRKPKSEFAILDAFDPLWREHFGDDLKDKGLTDDFILDNQEFIVDFLRQEQQSARKESPPARQQAHAHPPPPPPPSNDRSNSLRAPPPPPPAPPRRLRREEELHHQLRQLRDEVLPRLRRPWHHPLRLVRASPPRHRSPTRESTSGRASSTAQASKDTCRRQGRFIQSQIWRTAAFPTERSSTPGTSQPRACSTTSSIKRASTPCTSCVRNAAPTPFKSSCGANGPAFAASQHTASACVAGQSPCCSAAATFAFIPSPTGTTPFACLERTPGASPGSSIASAIQCCGSSTSTPTTTASRWPGWRPTSTSAPSASRWNGWRPAGTSATPSEQRFWIRIRRACRSCGPWACRIASRYSKSRRCWVA
ncbi:hypothetical protein MGG_02802 [Pyricularia oryzae 70-15]|uniref:WH1 domain-containing protein n=1 Tax=Pyricularia oryzae (strain 70-15 / ATCC MYA-4617 / FGSC 8958) TaxID=242507 RepID=G4NIY0_PYRO7|nr:uncharacterized protein MGG_02802 [Pyricularia oryzae 70-15]EHA46196.1 hypothetical protein MGG_02802 [Pyricularia oryzae 70-15]